MTFADRLKHLREKHKPKIYQKELADAIGVSRQAITMWETGQRIPDTVTLKKLADFFNVTTDYLLGRTDNPNDVNYEPTPQELEKVLREANIAFDGSPLDEEDKEDVIEFVKVALRALKKRNREKAQEKATDHQ